jgi:hypothetical protein
MLTAGIRGRGWVRVDGPLYQLEQARWRHQPGNRDTQPSPKRTTGRYRTTTPTTPTSGRNARSARSARLRSPKPHEPSARQCASSSRARCDAVRSRSTPARQDQ